jgi:hypothetical protein
VLLLSGVVAELPLYLLHAAAAAATSPLLTGAIHIALKQVHLCCCCTAASLLLLAHPPFLYRPCNLVRQQMLLLLLLLLVLLLLLQRQRCSPAPFTLPSNKRTALRRRVLCANSPCTKPQRTAKSVSGAKY